MGLPLNLMSNALKLFRMLEIFFMNMGTLDSVMHEMLSHLNGLGYTPKLHQMLHREHCLYSESCYAHAYVDVLGATSIL